jgi:riboflavin synthase
MRVIAHDTGCEVVFTLRRPGRSQEDHDADARAIQRDLATLKQLLES